MKKNIINADQARIKYFNYYVEFEHSIRRLDKKFKKKKTKQSRSLSYVVQNLGIFNYQYKLGIKMKLIKSQVRVRNWLAHSPKSTKASKKHFLLMKMIKRIINELNNL